MREVEEQHDKNLPVLAVVDAFALVTNVKDKNKLVWWLLIRILLPKIATNAQFTYLNFVLE